MVFFIVKVSFVPSLKIIYNINTHTYYKKTILCCMTSDIRTKSRSSKNTMLFSMYHKNSLNPKTKLHEVMYTRQAHCRSNAKQYFAYNQAIWFDLFHCNIGRLLCGKLKTFFTNTMYAKLYMCSFVRSCRGRERAMCLTTDFHLYD